MSSKTSLTVERDQAVTLFEELGLKNASSWKPGQFPAKFKALPKILDDDTAPETEASKSLLRKVLNAVNAGQSVTLVSSNGHAESNGHYQQQNDEPEETAAESEQVYQPEYGEQRIESIRIETLVQAKYNPAARSDQDTSAIKGLAKQLLNDGRVFLPILVRSDRKTIIDGHRRTAASALNGWETVPAIITNEDINPEAVYASINATARKLNGSDTLEVWLKDPDAIQPTASKRMGKLKDIVGKPLMAKLAKRGLSTRTIQTAIRIAGYCEVGDDADQIKAIVEWLLELPSGGIGNVMRHMGDKGSAAVLLKAVKAGKPLKVTATVEDD